MLPTHDVAVIGAGPAGSATAFFLARHGLDVLLLDKAAFPRDKTCGDGVSPRALAVLDKMGLLPGLLAHGTQNKVVRLFSPDGREVEAGIPAHPGLADFTLVVPRLVLDDLVRQRAVAAGAQFAGDAHVQNVRRAGAHVEIVAQGGRRFQARLAVLATGASVSLLQNAGVLKRTPPMMVAARAYYENLRGLDEKVNFHFDGVPLPGYGWVFPVSGTRANVGAGYFKLGRRRRDQPASPRAALDRFLTVPHLREVLAGAQQAGPVKGFPIRVDFANAPTCGDGLLLVGEACGLVNPLTGEGIDYALESAEIAADFVAERFSNRDDIRHCLPEYDVRLRRKFQRQFLTFARIREWYLRPRVLNLLVSIAERRPHLRTMFVDVVLGQADGSRLISMRAAWLIWLQSRKISPSGSSWQSALNAGRDSR